MSQLLGSHEELVSSLVSSMDAIMGIVLLNFGQVVFELVAKILLAW